MGGAGYVIEDYMHFELFAHIFKYSFIIFIQAAGEINLPPNLFSE